MLYEAVLSVCALITLHVVLALSFKLAQHGETGQYSFSPPVILVLSESVKFLMSSALFWRERVTSSDLTTDRCHPSATVVGSAWTQVSTGGLLWRTALLAAFYCLNNNIAFALFRVADGANINLIKSGGSIVSALLLWVVLKRQLSRTQWSALWLQVFGLVVAQFGPTCTNTPILQPYAYGLLLVSLLNSAGCAVWNDHMLKCKQYKAVSMHVINMSLYAFGFLLNGAILFYSLGPPNEGNIFSGFDRPETSLVLICQSSFGLAISAVYKYADAVVKTFALSCATSILLMIDLLFFGAQFSLVASMGCLVVFLATHLYVTNPVKQEYSAIPQPEDDDPSIGPSLKTTPKPTKCANIVPLGAS